jgi:hypothetical protein
VVGFRERQEQGTCHGAIRWASSSSPWRVAQCRTPCFGSFLVLGAVPDFPKLILLMYLTVLMFSTPLEISNELD